MYDMLELCCIQRDCVLELWFHLCSHVAISVLVMLDLVSMHATQQSKE
jgi:hypothetical protein